MAAAVKARGETAFAEAGDGIVLRFKNTDLVIIEEKFGREWFQALAESSLMGRPSLTQLLELARIGAKKDGEPAELDEAKLDDIPVYDLATKILDATCQSMRGMTFEEHTKDMIETMKALEGKDPPLLSPATTG